MTTSKTTDPRRFAFDVSLLIIANGFAGLLFMLVHVAMGRMMTSADYAVLVSLLGLLNILNVPSSAIRVMMARYVAEYAHGDDVSLWVTLVKRAFSRLTLVAIVGLIGWFGVSLLLPAYFDGYTIPSLWMLGLAAFVTLFSPVVFGTLQGARLFGWLALTGLVAAGGRLLLSIGAVTLGGQVTGVIAAVAGAALFSALIGYVPFHRLFVTTSPARHFDSKPIYGYLWPVLGGQLALFVLLNADLILSVRLLEGDTLQAYSKAAMLARTVLFLPLPVAIAMFPRAVNSPKRGLFWGPVVFTVSVSLVAALGITLLPGLPMKLMYNVEDSLHNELARLYVWAVLPLSLATVMAQYLWARHETRAVLWAAPMVAGYVISLLLFAHTPAQIVGCLAMGGLLIVIWFTFSVAKSFRSTREPT